MNAALHKDILEETYTDVQQLIFKMVHKFIRQSGGDFEEYLSEANLAFVQAMKKYDKTKGQISTWIGFQVWHTLLEKKRNQSKDRHLFTETIPERKVESRQHAVTSLLSDLSQDARFVASLVLDIPEEIVSPTIKNGSRPANLRKSLHNYLLDMGWTYSKIQECFEEVRQALEA